MSFPKEQIPDKDYLLKRISRNTLRDGKMTSYNFKDSELSTNWAEYADAKQTRDQVAEFGREPSNYGVVDLNVADVRSISSQEVDHDPLSNNQAHTLISGKKDDEARLKLKDFANWVIQPDQK